MRMYAAQYNVMEGAAEMTAMAIRTCGGQSMLKSLPLERMYATAAAALSCSPTRRRSWKTISASWPFTRWTSSTPRLATKAAPATRCGGAKRLNPVGAVRMARESVEVTGLVRLARGGLVARVGLCRQVASSHRDGSSGARRRGALIRAFTVHGEDTMYRERLTWLSHSDRTLGYSIVEGIRGVDLYEARISVDAA